MSSSKVCLLLLVILSSLHYFSVSSFEFEVGDTKGWIVPSTNDTKMYNEWASKNRFQIGDAIRFKYKKDSVMAVSDSDYKRCNSTYPIFFSNNGNTLYRLDHSGLFYFISGASGHCERGQKMIIKVMSPEDSEGRDEPNSSDVAAPVAGASTLVILQLALSFLGFHLL